MSGSQSRLPPCLRLRHALGSPQVRKSGPPTWRNPSSRGGAAGCSLVLYFVTYPCTPNISGCPNRSWLRPCGRRLCPVSRLKQSSATCAEILRCISAPSNKTVAGDGKPYPADQGLSVISVASLTTALCDQGRHPSGSAGTTFTRGMPLVGGFSKKVVASGRVAAGRGAEHNFAHPGLPARGGKRRRLRLRLRLRLGLRLSRRASPAEIQRTFTKHPMSRT